MSRPVLASETAALGLADEAYGQMVTLEDPGGAAALEPELIRIFDALQNQTVPAMPTDIAHGVRSMRNGAFEILGDVMAGMVDDRATDVLRLAEANMRARLVQQAREAVNGRNRGAGLAWTRYFGNRLGGALRNVVGLVNEGATGRVFWGQGSYEDRRVETEVQAQIAARFAGQSYNTLTPADREMVRQEVGRLAPNILAFNPRELLEWARVTNVTLAPPPPPPTPATVTAYEMLEGLMGQENLVSQYAIPILSLAQKNPAYLAHLQEIYYQVFVRNVSEKTTELAPIEAAYNAELNRRNEDVSRQKDLSETITRVEAALALLTQVQSQENLRTRSQRDANDMGRLLRPGVVPPLDSRSRETILKNQQASREKANAASSSLIEKITELKTKYPTELLAAARSGPTAIVGGLESILITDRTTGGLPIGAVAGQINDPSVLIAQFRSILNEDSLPGTTSLGYDLSAVLGAGRRGLKQQLTEYSTRVDRQGENYSTTYPPAVAGGATLYSQGYKNFTDLKEKYDAAVAGVSEARRTVPSRESSRRITPHQLLFQMLNRQLQVEIPPTGVVPPAGTRNLPLEEAQLRATIATMMLMDRVDSSMDEGFAVRQASNLARNRVIRFVERGTRITFKEFVDDNLTRQEAFKELGTLTLETTANDILNLINTEKIKIENLPELMRQLELLGQDQLAGEGNLEFGVDVRPLLYQIQLAWYRRKAEPLVDKVNEPGVDNKAEKLLAMLKEEAPKAIPPQVTPGSQPLSVETKKQSWLRRTLDKVREELKGVEDTSEKGEVLKRKMGVLEAIGPAFGAVGSEVVAEIIANAVIKIPKLFSGKGKAATEVAGEAVEEVVEGAASGAATLEKVRRKTAQKAARVAKAVKKAA